MKQTNLLTRMLLLCLMIVGSASVWADDEPNWKYEIGTNDGSKLNTTAKTFTVDEAHVWSYANSTVGKGSPEVTYSSGYLKFGNSKNVYFNPVVLTTDAFKDVNITKVAVTVKHNGKVGATLTVKQGDITIGTAEAEAQNSSYQTVTCAKTKTGAGGTLTISYAIAQALYLSKIEVWYEDNVTKHKLYSDVNPAGAGTVTLGATEVGENKNTSIVAEATNPAYQFNNWTATSGTIADANAASTTFTMGTTDATVTANFELKPTHTITVTPTDDGTITVKNGEDEVTSGSTIYEGATLTISALAGENKEFASWSVTGATPESTTENPTTLTVGTGDITIAATFNTITTHAIKWSVNGTIVKTENIKEGTAITFAAPTEGIPAGYVFKGWVVEADKITTPTDEEPKTKYVTSGTSTDDITYYAVMAKEEGTPITFVRYEKVTEAQTDWSGTYILGATYNGGTDETKKGTWIYTAPSSSEKYGEKDAIGELTTEKADYEIVIAKSTNGYTIYHTNSEYYFSYGGSNNELNFAESVSDKKQEWTITDVAVIKNAQSTSRILKYNGSSPRFACYTSGQTATDLYKRIEEGGVSYSNYCTTVPTTETVTKLADRTYGTYVTKNALDFTGADVEAYIAKGITGEGDAATLEIEKVTTVKAGTPIIVKSDDKSVTSADVNIITDAAAADNAGNNLVAGDGTDVTTDATYTYYYIAGDQFHKATTGDLVVGKAYLKLETASAKAFTIAIGGDGETTGINTLDSRLSTLDKAQSMYNLAGQKVSNSYKGIVIINGKKVIK